MQRFSFVIILSGISFLFFGVVQPTPPRITMLRMTDSLSHLQKAKDVLTERSMSLWRISGIIGCYYDLDYEVLDNGRQEHSVDSTGILIAQVDIRDPRLASGRNYSAAVTFRFKHGTCINAIDLIEFYYEVVPLVKNYEARPEVSQFLEKTHASAVRIFQTERGIRWLDNDDTLHLSYWSKDAPLYWFSFHDKDIIPHWAEYVGRWDFPHLVQFQTNSTLGYVKFQGDRIRASSGPTCDGAYEYFVATLGHTVDFFRLRNGRDWSTFREYVAAHSVLFHHLDSLGYKACSRDTSKNFGYTVKRHHANRGCEACGDIIYVSMSCPSSPSPVVVGVQIGEYLIPRFVGLFDSTAIN